MTRVALAALAVVLGGCLLPAPPDPPLYFDVESRGGGTVPPRRAGSGLRLAPVASPVFLRAHMVWRRSDVEIGFYEQRRWAELPETYVARALARELFDVQGFSRTASAASPTVTASLLAFEEVLAPEHEGRVEVLVEVRSGDAVLLHRQFGARRPVEGGDGAGVARAIGDALDEVTAAVGPAVRDALARR